MKVLMLTTSYPDVYYPNRGIFVYHLVDNLRNIGMDVDVLYLTKYKHLIVGSGIFQNLKISWMARLEFPFYILNFYINLLKKSKEYDIIHANWELTAFLALLSGFYHRKKILLTERSPQIINTKNKILSIVSAYTYRNVDKLVVISNDSRRVLINKYHNLNPVVIQNGVSSISVKSGNVLNLRKKLKISKNSKVVLFVGRLTQVKSVDFLIEGFAMLDFKNKLLLVVGSGEEKNNLECLVKNLGLTDNVIFTGNVNPKEVYSYMHLADVLVLPSTMETGGNVILEALMCGLPVISTRVGWADDYIVDGYDGYFIEKRNAKDIGNKLNKVLSNNKLLKIMKKNALHVADNELISWQECAKLYEKEYKLLVG